MTRKRDRYQSSFDAGVPGVRAAVYDIGLALYILEEIAKEHELLRERKTFHNGQSWTFAQALEIAREALNQSVSPVSWIYQRLQQNEEAARLMEQTLDDKKWSAYRFALSNTLNNHPIISRGFVSGARRMIARQEAEKRRLEQVRKTIDESSVECERCGAVVVEYDLYHLSVDGVDQRVCSSCKQAALLVEERREREVTP